MNIRTCLIISSFLLVTGCTPDELQSFDYYLLNPEELADAVDFCNDSDDRRAYADYCKTIDSFDNYLISLDNSLNIDKKAKVALAEAKRLLELKREGLKR